MANLVVFNSLAVRAGLDETPEFPEQIGEGNDESGHKGDGDAGHELRPEGCCLELRLHNGNAETVSQVSPVAESAQRIITDKIRTDGPMITVSKNTVHVHENHYRQIRV